MDEVEEAMEKAKREWEEAFGKTQGDFGIRLIELPDVVVFSSEVKRLGSARLAHFRARPACPQLLSDHQVASARALLDSWITLASQLRLSLRNANLKAKDNMRKSVKEQRELVLGGGEQSTIRRRNFQTKAGMLV